MEPYELAQAATAIGTDPGIDVVTQTTPSATGNGLSLISLFWEAHPVVQLVILGLLVASIWSWAIVIDKIMLFRRTRKQIEQFESVFWSGQSLEELYRSLLHRRNHTLPAIFVAAMREWKRSFESGANTLIGLQMRIDKVMDVTIARQTERLERRLLFLASVGASAPFIGLFGTVWGIMSSFQAIATIKNTSLAVVAPGIAEALFATAIGLFAAIPAVIAYNKFTNIVARFATHMEGFADEFSAILSRQIDDMKSPRRARGAEPRAQPVGNNQRHTAGPTRADVPPAHPVTGTSEYKPASTRLVGQSASHSHVRTA